MKAILKWQSWLYSLAGAFIGGGAGAVISGLTSMGLAPDKFNLSDTEGFHRLLKLVAMNFVLSGILGAALWLKQKPLPDVAEVDTQFFRKAPEGAATTVNNQTKGNDNEKQND